MKILKIILWILLALLHLRECDGNERQPIFHRPEGNLHDTAQFFVFERFRVSGHRRPFFC